MKIGLTVHAAMDLDEIRTLIPEVRARHENLTVYEAPSNLDYAFDFPIVSIDRREGFKRRFYGEDARKALRDLATSAPCDD